MPCWTIIESRVEFLSTSTDVDLLKKAFEALGFVVRVTEQGLRLSKGDCQGTYDRKTGKLALSGTQVTGISEVKRAYSKEVVIHQAKKQGWQLSWSRDKEGNEVATVMKRG